MKTEETSQELGDKKPGRKGKKAIKVLSVEEFHNLGKKKSIEDPPVSLQDDSPEFFNHLESQVKRELAKERHERAPVIDLTTARRPVADEELTLARVRDDFDKKVKEVEELRDENSVLRDELKDVKNRNKKLCNILAQGESKYKGNVVKFCTIIMGKEISAMKIVKKKKLN